MKSGNIATSGFVALLSLMNIEAWSIIRDTNMSTDLQLSTSTHTVTRRSFASCATLIVPLLIPKKSQAAGNPTSSKTVQDAIQELQQSRDKLKDIPDLLEAQEWEKVRGILKVPPVNKLWNLGDSQNTVLVLAKETGNIDLFELKDDLAYNLQICDQLTYDNAFVYFQPGNGKYKIKEPQQLAQMAMKQIQQIIDLVSSDS